MGSISSSQWKSKQWKLEDFLLKLHIFQVTFWIFHYLGYAPGRTEKCKIRGLPIFASTSSSTHSAANLSLAWKRSKRCICWFRHLPNGNRVSAPDLKYIRPETNSSHLKMDGWKTAFLLEWPIFTGYVCFRVYLKLIILNPAGGSAQLSIYIYISFVLFRHSFQCS